MREQNTFLTENVKDKNISDENQKPLKATK